MNINKVLLYGVLSAVMAGLGEQQREDAKRSKPTFTDRRKAEKAKRRKRK